MQRKQKFILWLIIFSAIAIYTFINWQKHIHFQTFAWDTSVFDQQIYLASIGKTPYTSLHKFNGLADHFHPILLIIGAMLYRFFPDPKTLYLLQGFVVCLSAYPLFLICKYYFNKLKLSEFGGFILSISLIIMYLFSVGFQTMILDEIHDDVFAALPLLWMLYFITTKNWKMYWISFIAVLLTKEEYGLLGLPIGLYIILKYRYFKTATITAITGIAAFYFLTFQLMPALSGQKVYEHFLEENHPRNILVNFFKHPQLFFTSLINHPAKIKTITSTLTSFSFLPLFSPLEIVLPLSSLAIRFYDPTTIRRFEFNNHYASPLIPFAAFSAVLGVVNLIKLAKKRKFNQKFIYLLSFLIIAISAVQNIIYHGPINSLFKLQFYETHPWEIDARELIKMVPQNVTIASQNSLLPHLSQRDNFYLLPEISNAKYIAVDLHPGPNKWAPYSLEQMDEFINSIINNGEFEIIWQKNQAILLKRRS